ncbi:MAG: hypothetical protein LBD20_04490 [Spirochaetaceae bacterium]|jgi:diaminopimelate epimerase|nr:hypothetical protein [Spirochaetaceae bacterium]
MNVTEERRSCKIVLANPAGNITAFVLDGVSAKPDERAVCARRIMAEDLPFYAGGVLHGMVRVEQAGFVLKPEDADKPWRLEMAGGEFCGNAARSLALLAARMAGRLPAAGSLRLPVAVSGAAKPLDVRIEQAGGQAVASITMPLPVAKTAVCALGQEFPVYHFEGISHVIAGGVEPDRAAFFAIKAAFEAGNTCFALPSALGVMFCPPPASQGKLFTMTPAVYVYSPESFMFESSCGSGTAAFAYHHFEGREGGGTAAIRQPGGIIEAAAAKEAGTITRVEIGGPVVLSDSQMLLW